MNATSVHLKSTYLPRKKKKKKRQSNRNLLLQRLLLLRINQLPPLNNQPLPTPHSIHIPLRHVLPIRQLTQILKFLLSSRNPERVFVERLETSEDELWLRGAGGPFADFFGETERFGDGQEREDCEEGGTFFHGFGENAAAAAGYDAVDPAEDFGCFCC